MLDELDKEMKAIAERPGFIIGDKFEEECGKSLGRLLADMHWPAYIPGRGWGYAIKGDDSNIALRRLQRKYHAALLALEEARGK